MEKEIFGEGSIKSLKGILQHYSAQRVFLVTGKRSYEFSGAKEKLEDLLRNRNFYRHFDFKENPKYSDLLKGAKDIRAYKPDIIVAVGGGSVLDTAKILAVLPTETPMAKKVIKGEMDFNDKIAPIVAIPTTSGSGSEATHFAVAYLNNVKYSVAGNSLLPDHVIIDPELTYSMPPYQTAVSGMDALCQAMESCWAKGSNVESKNYAKFALDLIIPNLEKAVNEPNEYARSEIAKGAYFSGKAINISKTTAPHAFSYHLTTKYGIPHGEAVALCMGAFIKINYPYLSNETTEIFHNAFKVNSCKGIFKKFHELRSNIGFTRNLSDIGLINKHAWNNYFLSINEERLNNNPGNVDFYFLKRLLEENT